MPKIDIAQVPVRTGSGYPEQFRGATKGREKAALGNAVGLNQFGVNLTRLKPGAASSLRHWHENEDEFVFILEGEVVLCENDGETVLKAGEAAGWKAGEPNGHCLVNRSARDVLYLEIGTRAPTERAHYPGIDLQAVKDAGGFHYLRNNGEPY